MKKKIKLKKKYQNLIFDIPILLLIIILVIALFKAANVYYYDYKNQKDSVKLMQKIIKNNNIDKENTMEYEIDFDELEKINSDVVGWIIIPNTDVNEPILKGKDNAFYLTKNIYKEYNRSGSIFMNYKNNSDFLDNNTILFGHNSSNGTMFGELKKIYNMELGEMVNIYIYTKQGNYRYMVYSAYYASGSDAKPLATDIKFFNQTDKEYKYDMTDLETLTLSTCHTDNTKRLIIHAIKQKEF